MSYTYTKKKRKKRKIRFFDEEETDGVQSQAAWGLSEVEIIPIY